MGVEMHQRHFTEVLRVSAQQWQSHEVVAAEREHALARSQHFLGVLLQLVGQVLCVAKVEHHVAAVDHFQTVTQVEIPRPAFAFPCQIHRNLTDCRRAQTCA